MCRVAEVAAVEPVVVAAAPEEEEVVVEKQKPLIAATSLVSEVGSDYGPLMGALREAKFQEADQLTRDKLIEIAGAEAQQRGYVYFSEAQVLPEEDLKTIELLWNYYSDGKFGYTVQKKMWRLQNGDFESFCRKIGWNVDDADTGVERKRRWFGNSEFIYDLATAPRGHLPLTSALRGTQLLKALINHKLWDIDDWKDSREWTTLDD